MKDIYNKSFEKLEYEIPIINREYCCGKPLKFELNKIKDSDKISIKEINSKNTKRFFKGRISPYNKAIYFWDNESPILIITDSFEYDHKIILFNDEKNEDTRQISSIKKMEEKGYRVEFINLKTKHLESMEMVVDKDVQKCRIYYPGVDTNLILCKINKDSTTNENENYHIEIAAGVDFVFVLALVVFFYDEYVCSDKTNVQASNTASTTTDGDDHLKKNRNINKYNKNYDEIAKTNVIIYPYSDGFQSSDRIFNTNNESNIKNKKKREIRKGIIVIVVIVVMMLAVVVVVMVIIIVDRFVIMVVLFAYVLVV
ncbi:hypothetical protein PIROE2DRAFT_63093 [Piromyces sp. E2]|nr:hypothetical protein PIROE2DRAFT_63093 [Piromyces sp. E2]|eukprot:OUM60501.1 hypothetical protein PIROE2DRAFT_63093 [Piromyces sp. E2]